MPFVMSVTYLIVLSRNAHCFPVKYIGVSEITRSQAFCLWHHQQNGTFSEGENLPGWWQPETGWHAEWTQRQMGYHLWKICGKVKCSLRQFGYLVGFFQTYSSDALWELSRNLNTSFKKLFLLSNAPLTQYLHGEGFVVHFYLFLTPQFTQKWYHSLSILSDTWLAVVFHKLISM